MVTVYMIAAALLVKSWSQTPILVHWLLLMQGCQVLLNFSILLLKLQFCYWNFHEILAKILKFVLISQMFTHKNTEICVKLCKNTEINAIRYWSDFPEVGSPVDVECNSTGINFQLRFAKYACDQFDFFHEICNVLICVGT